MTRNSHTGPGEPAWDPAGELEPDLAAQCAGLARKLREREARTIGLAPAGAEVIVAPLALRLASALAANASKPIAVWSAHAIPGDGDGRTRTAGFVTSWRGPGLAMVTPTPGRLDIGALLAALEDQPRQYDRVMVDLTGLDRFGEEPIVCEALDALVVVARSGSTRLRQLRLRLRAFPRDRVAGVLLTGV